VNADKVRLQEESSSAKKDVSDALGRLEGLQNALVRLQTTGEEAQTLAQENEKLRKELKDSSGKFDQLQADTNTRLQEIEDQVTQLCTDKENLRKELDSAALRYDALQTDEIKMQEASKRKQSAMQKELEDTVAQFRQLEADHAQLQADANDIYNTMERSKRERELESNEMAHLRAENDDLQNELSRLKKDVDSLHEDAQRHDASIQVEFRNQVETLERVIGERHAELASLREFFLCMLCGV
jgi:chromosome segregation ATPase